MAEPVITVAEGALAERSSLYLGKPLGADTPLRPGPRETGMQIPDYFLNNWLDANGVETAELVNAGMCEEFATDLSELLSGSQVVYTEDFVSWDNDEFPGGHAWVMHDGKFYDSECLGGVSDWKSLPFFVRRTNPEPEHSAAC